jgi:hypothetical protein
MQIPITANEVYNILRRNFGTLIPIETFNTITIIADTSYLTTDSAWLREMAIHDPILSPSRYRRDIFDCDDYVLYLKTSVSLYAANSKNITRPFAVGYILTKLHAFNFGIDENKRLYILNTQSTQRDLIAPQTPEECANFLDLGLSNNKIQQLYI